MTETKMKEQVVMTPKAKTENSTTLLIERKIIDPTNNGGKVHIAGGEHTGIVINKEIHADQADESPPHLTLEFRVYLVSSQTGKHTQESRKLQFWFRPITDNGGSSEDKRATVAQDFFRELVSPKDFPRDYVGFIKKIMKLLQFGYESVAKVEIKLEQLTGKPIPLRSLSIQNEHNLENASVLTTAKVLEIIESAYPNPMTVADMAKQHSWKEDDVVSHLIELQKRDLVKPVDNGAFTRQQSNDVSITVVKQMPQMVSDKQPTIAVITAQYCEKLAVDAMLENKETFVRYTTVGESNVYTLGNIGSHRIVCTKLPSVGHTREAMTAAGNTTTRLLGTFQRVDYVFLVGIGGGVPHYTDYNKHVRLGDVVVSYPSKDGAIYFYGEKSIENDDEMEIKPYRPKNLNLQQIALNLQSEDYADKMPPWFDYLHDGLEILQGNAETDFKRPNAETDKLYMNINEHDIIEVAHPLPFDKSLKRHGDCPRLHLSAVASGRQIVKDDVLRQKFAHQMGVLSFDCEFDAVIESILGNCKDSFMCIRGIADYKDGTGQKEWQPYAALAAASVMKAVVCRLN